MRMVWSYVRKYLGRVCRGMTFRFIGTIGELLIPYIFEYVIDYVAPSGRTDHVFLWGGLMVLIAILARVFMVKSSRTSISVARDCTEEMRSDLFRKTANLSGRRFDAFTLPSLTARMTSDSYNVQNFITRIQNMGIRIPIMLIGGLTLALSLDAKLALILCVIIPVAGVVTVLVSRHGIPLYAKVQDRVDDIVRVMRENITGIRVVKALSKTEYEMERFKRVNHEHTAADLKAGTVMAIPGPFLQLTMNIGLTLVVVLGAYRVNGGDMKPGVILAFLTYFNQILGAVQGINRLFIMVSKTTASADRIAEVLSDPEDQEVIPLTEETALHTDDHIVFKDVTFSYASDELPGSGSAHSEERENCLENISFSIGRGESLGIIGATGCGKTTVINLLMRFYDTDRGAVYVDGRDVRTYEKDELRKKFGVVFQNDMIFADTLYNNIAFGRDVTEEDVRRAAEDARVADYIESLADGYDYEAHIKGANLSGGQKQRVLIARALAGRPEILVLDDASSALDYKTDSELRQAINRNYAGVTTVMVAQRVSSVMNMTNILFLDDGKVLAYGSHSHLLSTCPEYREIYESQMGELN